MKCEECGTAEAAGMLVDLAGDDDVEHRLCGTCGPKLLADVDEQYRGDVVFAEGIFNNTQLVDNLDRLRQEHHWVYRGDPPPGIRPVPGGMSYQEQVLRANAAKYGTDGQRCHHCLEPGGDQQQLVELHDRQGYVATVHFEGCRPRYPHLTTDYD